MTAIDEYCSVAMANAQASARGGPGRWARLVWLWLALAFALLLTGCATGGGERRTGYTYHVIGNPAAATPHAVQDGAMLVGGGDWPYAAFRWFFQRAGNGHIVILRASYGAENQQEMFEKIGGVASIQTFVFDARAGAMDPRVATAIDHADGIFLGGGDQAKYIRFWQDTPVLAALNRHVAAGKPIGGTSAGLAVLGRHVYGAMDGGSLTSETALADAGSSQLTLVSDFLRVEPLYSAGVLTDTHFAERHRQGRLLAMLALLQRQHPGQPLLGLGVDENTALCVTRDSARLITDGHGQAWLFRPGPAVPQSGKPLQTGSWSIDILGPDSRLSFPSWTVENPARQLHVQAVDGVLHYDPPIASEVKP